MVTNNSESYLTLEKLETYYKYSLKLSAVVWKIYQELEWQPRR